MYGIFVNENGKVPYAQAIVQGNCQRNTVQMLLSAQKKG